MEERGTDGVICLGDILDFAPHPSESPADSIIDLLGDGGRETYRSGDEGAILESIRSVDLDTAAGIAESRYREFFDGIEGDIYVLAGNQDFPNVLRSVIGEYPNAHHADELSWAVAIDGVVPEHAEVPEGVFPGECPRSRFQHTLEESDESALLAHRLPTGFDSSDWDFDLAITAHHGKQTITSDGVARVAPYGSGDGLLIRVENGRASVTSTANHGVDCRSRRPDS